MQMQRVIRKMMGSTCRHLNMEPNDIKIWFDCFVPQQVDNYVCGVVTTIAAVFHAKCDAFSKMVADTMKVQIPREGQKAGKLLGPPYTYLLCTGFRNAYIDVSIILYLCERTHVHLCRLLTGPILGPE